MPTGFDEFENRIHALIERESECDELFEEVKNGNGECSLRYLELRDSCKQLRKEIFKTAMSAGLTRENIKSKLEQARSDTVAPKQKQKIE
jgi:hypothetical protein